MVVVGMNTALLDTNIKPNSRFATVLFFCWLFSLFVIGILAHLVWWQLGLLIFVSLSVLLLHRLCRIIPLHITQLDHTKNGFDSLTHQAIDWHIQLKQKTNQSPHKPLQLWQGNLIKTNDFGMMIFLSYQIIEPTKKQFGVAIWQDQVTNDDWRKLKILSRLY